MADYTPIALQHVNLTVPRGKLHLSTEFYGDVIGFASDPVPALQRDTLQWFRIGNGPQQIHVAFEKDPDYKSTLSSRHPCFQLASQEALLKLQQRIWDHHKAGGEAAALECDEPGQENSGAKGSLKHSCVIPVKNAPCERCTRSQRECTFLAPSRTALRRAQAASAGSLPSGRATTFEESPFDYELSGTRGPGTRLSVARQLAGLLASDDERSEAMSNGSTDAYYASLDMESNGIEESHYLGSAAFMDMTLDNQPEKPGTTSSGDLVYRQVASPNQPPVYFLRSPSLIYGLTNGEFAAEKAWQTVTAKLREENPELSSKLYQLFIERTLPAMPMVNRERLESACAGAPGAGPFPCAILVGIVIHALALIPSARHLARSLWGVAVNLEDNECRSPRLQTLQLQVCEIYGWPVSTPGGNHMSITRAVGVAQLLGLHRDCARWKLPRWERATRKRIWYLLYIADKWNALQYGRPSNMNKNRVPLPTLFDEDTPSADERLLSFVGMCRLTSILDTLLPILMDNEEVSVASQRTILVSAARGLDDLSPMLDTNGPGQLSLRLCYQGIVILLCQMSLDLRPADRAREVSGLEVCDRSLAAVTDLCEFVENIDLEASGEYWAPWSSLNLTRAVSLLLRLCRMAMRGDWSQKEAIFQNLDRLVIAMVQAEQRGWHIAQDAIRVVKIQLGSVSDLPCIAQIQAHITPSAPVFNGTLPLPVNPLGLPALAGTASNDDVAALFNLMLQGDWMAGVDMSNGQV